MPNKNFAAHLKSVEDQSYFEVFVFVEVLQTLSHWSSGQMFASHRRGQQFAPPGGAPTHRDWNREFPVGAVSYTSDTDVITDRTGLRV